MPGLMLSNLLVLAAAQGQIAIRSYDPPPARPWQQSVQFTCGATTLRIAGYGAAQPAGRAVEVLVNGRPLQGAGVAALRRDLAGRAAVYRLGARCPRGGRSIGLIIHRGEQSDGTVTYQAGDGLIVNGRLQNYSGLRQANADAFWFR